MKNKIPEILLLEILNRYINIMQELRNLIHQLEQML